MIEGFQEPSLQTIGAPFTHFTGADSPCCIIWGQDSLEESPMSGLEQFSRKKKQFVYFLAISPVITEMAYATGSLYCVLNHFNQVK